MAATRLPSVTFVLTSLGVGGAEQQFTRLILHLAQRGYDARVVCLQADTPTAARLRSSGVPVESGAAGDGSIVRRVWTVTCAMRRLVLAWRAEPPDIVHGVLIHGYLFGGLAAWLARVPVFISSRRSLGHFKERRFVLRMLERFVNRRTAVVIANSEAVRADTITRESLAPEQVLVIYNGMESLPVEAGVRERTRAELGVAPGEPVGVVVANLIHYKAHDVLLRAWHRVVTAVPEARLWVVGEGPERDALTHLVAELGLSSHVRLLGLRADVPHLLAAADMQVHASREEGFCNALLEGMGAGLPIVATDVGGNREAVEHDVTGLLVPADDQVALAEAVVRVLADQEWARSLGRAGQRRVRSAFTEGRMVQAYDDLYRRLARREPWSAAACAGSLDA